MARKNNNKTPKTSKVKAKVNNSKTRLGFKTDVYSLSTDKYYDLFKQLVFQTNRRIKKTVNGKTSDSKEVARINQLVDQANAVKVGSGSKRRLVDNKGSFVRTDKNGVRLFAQSKKEFEKLSIHEKRALIKSMQKLNNEDKYGENALSKEGVKSYYQRNEDKMRSTLEGYVTKSPAFNKAKEKGIDIESRVPDIINSAVNLIYNYARNNQYYSSEQIVDDLLRNTLSDINALVDNEIDKITNQRQMDRANLQEQLNRNRARRGRPTR